MKLVSILFTAFIAAPISVLLLAGSLHAHAYIYSYFNPSIVLEKSDHYFSQLNIHILIGIPLFYLLSCFLIWQLAKKYLDRKIQKSH